MLTRRQILAALFAVPAVKLLPDLTRPDPFAGALAHLDGVLPAVIMPDGVAARLVHTGRRAFDVYMRDALRSTGPIARAVRGFA